MFFPSGKRANPFTNNTNARKIAIMKEVLYDQQQVCQSIYVQTIVFTHFTTVTVILSNKVQVKEQ